MRSCREEKEGGEDAERVTDQDGQSTLGQGDHRWAGGDPQQEARAICGQARVWSQRNG